MISKLVEVTGVGAFTSFKISGGWQLPPLAAPADAHARKQD